jgi:hypothetical protein
MAAEVLLIVGEYGSVGWGPLAAGLLPLISDLVAEEPPPRIVFRELPVLLLLGFDVLPFDVVIGALSVLVVGILPLSNPDDGVVLFVVLDGLKVRFPFGGSGSCPVLLSEGESELAY